MAQATDDSSPASGDVITLHAGKKPATQSHRKGATSALRSKRYRQTRQQREELIY